MRNVYDIVEMEVVAWKFAHTKSAAMSWKLRTGNARRLDRSRTRLSRRRGGVLRTVRKARAARSDQIHLFDPCARRSRGILIEPSWQDERRFGAPRIRRAPDCHRQKRNASGSRLLLAPCLLVRAGKKGVRLPGSHSGRARHHSAQRGGSAVSCARAAAEGRIPARTHSRFHRAVRRRNALSLLRRRGDERRDQPCAAYHLDRRPGGVWPQLG